MQTRPTTDRRTILAGMAAAGGALLLGRAARAAGLPPMTPADFTVAAGGLEKPEGLAVAADGRVFLSQGRSAVAVLEPNGAVRHVGQPLAANGLALDRDGTLLVAHFGLLAQGPGPLQRLDPRTGEARTLADAVDGRTLVASNFPVVALDGTIYCTHSTWGPAVNIGNVEPAGFVYGLRPDGSVFLARGGLRGPNGCCLGADGRHLYVALTAAGRVVRLERRPDGTLGEPEPYGPVLGDVAPNAMAADIRALPPEARARLGYPDGIAFDALGNLWVTLPFSNRLVAITPDRAVVDVLADPAGTVLSMPTNLAWGGADMRDLYVVSRGNGCLLRARSPVAGLPLTFH